MFKFRNILKIYPIYNAKFYSSRNNFSKKIYQIGFAVSGFITISSGIGLYCLYQNEKLINLENKIEKAKTAKQHIGVTSIGGEFDLIDHNGLPKRVSDFRGKWLLIYFGFCNCPDICPDQLDKMVMIVERLDMKKTLPPIQPIFVTVDPERDNPTVMKEYIKEFSHKILGLTGETKNIDAMAKLYRVYYSMGPKDQFGDYIVDHAIIMYLVGPDGQFVEYYGQNKSVPEVCKSIEDYMLKRTPVGQ